MCLNFPYRCLLALAMCSFPGLIPAARAQLVAVEEDTGRFYQVSTADASLQPIGYSGLTGIGALEFNPVDGHLYGFTTGATPVLYRFDISPAFDSVTAQPIGPLGVFTFEGGLAFSPAGTAYAVNGGVTVPALLTLDLTTGHASIVGSLSTRHDIAGLGWRNDGMLLALDSTSNTLGTLNLTTAALAVVEDVGPTVGGLGGMALLGDSGYFVTAGPLAVNPGSNALYRFDPYTGEQFFVGDFENIIMGSGFSGLAVIPEPATLSLLAIAGLALLRRARSTSH